MQEIQLRVPVYRLPSTVYRLLRMAIVYIPTQLRSLTGGAGQVEVPGATLRQVIAGLDEAHPGLAARLQHGDALAPGLAVSVDGAFSNRGLLTKVGPTSEIHFLPAFGGG